MPSKSKELHTSDHFGQTLLLNVDLHIESKEDLGPLVHAFGKKVHVLFNERWKRTYIAHLEVNTRRAPLVNALVEAFCEMIEKLGASERGLWDRARRRQFNVGVQCGNLGPKTEGFYLKARAVGRVGALNAEILYTIYAPTKSPAWRGSRTPSWK